MYQEQESSSFVSGLDQNEWSLIEVFMLCQAVIHTFLNHWLQVRFQYNCLIINDCKSELFINGFIRGWNKGQREDNKQISNELLIVISKHYLSHNIIFAESGNKIYTKTMHCYEPTTCLLNSIFNDEMCDKVEIKFLIKKSDDYVFVTFGYLHKRKENEQPAVAYRLR